MRPRLAVIAAAGASFALLGCASSPPTQFFALNVQPPAASVTGALPVDSIPIRLQPVSLPAELDRLQWVQHEGTNRVHIDELRRWTAPLEDQVRAVLSGDLALRLPNVMADPAEATTADPRRLLSVTFPRLQVATDCSVVLQADWVLKQPSGDSAHGQQDVEQPARSACGDALAAALSSALATLSDQLAQELRQQPSLRAAH